MFGQFAKGGTASPFFNGSRNALGQQQPLGNDVPIPGIDDHLHRLVEEIALDELAFHTWNCFLRIAAEWRINLLR